MVKPTNLLFWYFVFTGWTWFLDMTDLPSTTLLKEDPLSNPHLKNNLTQSGQGFGPCLRHGSDLEKGIQLKTSSIIFRMWSQHLRSWRRRQVALAERSPTIWRLATHFVMYKFHLVYYSLRVYFSLIEKIFLCTSCEPVTNCRVWFIWP